LHIWKNLRNFVVEKRKHVKRKSNKNNPLILTIMINDVIYKAKYVLLSVRGLRDEPQNVGPEDLIETLEDLDELRRYLEVYLRVNFNK